ncbi:MAG: CRISPR-associated protein Cas4 [Candidatus Thorarchaeota archaeon]
MSRKSRSSEHSDVAEQYLSPTDVKQYVFCPRVTYFTRVMKLRPIMGSQQEAGKKSHDKLAKLEKRRKYPLKTKLPLIVKTKEFEIPLISNRYKVRGRLDMLILTHEGEWIPVEFKDMRSNKRKLHLDHKYQLIALALLVEEKHNTIVRRGFIHYTRDEMTIEMKISSNMRTRCLTYIERIRQMIIDGKIPDPRTRCKHIRIGCGFADQCIDR